MAILREANGRTRSVLQLAVVSIGVGTATAFAFPFLSLFLTSEIRVSPVALGAFMLVSPIASVVVSSVLGKVSDRGTHRRAVMVAGALAGAVGYGLFAVLRDYWLLMAVSVTLVAAATSLLPQTFAYAKGLSRAGPMVVTSLRTLISLAWVTGPPIAAVLVAGFGYDGLFWATGGMYLVLALLVATLPRTEQAVPEQTDDGRPGGRVGLAVPAFIFLQGATALAVSGLPLFVTTELGGTAGDAGLVLGLCAGLEIPLMLGFALLTKRFSIYPLVLAGASVALAYHGLMLLTGTTWQVAAAQVLHAIGISAVMGLGISYFQSLDPGRPGHASTLFSNTATAGTMIAGVLLGVAQHVGFRSIYAMSLAMCVLGLALLFRCR